MSSFTVLRFGANQQAVNDPAKRALLAKKEDLEQKIDTLKISKGCDGSRRLQEAVDRGLLELAKVQEGLDK